MFLTLLHPRVLGPALNRVLRLARREPLPRTPSGRGLAVVVGFQLIVWLLLGLQAWLLLVGMGAPTWPSLPVAVGGYALAYSLGQMAVGLPAGAGVREAALTLVLSTVIAAPAALVVALLARVIATVADLTLAAVFAARAAHRRRTADQSPIRGGGRRRTGRYRRWGASLQHQERGHPALDRGTGEPGSGLEEPTRRGRAGLHNRFVRGGDALPADDPVADRLERIAQRPAVELDVDVHGAGLGQALAVVLDGVPPEMAALTSMGPNRSGSAGTDIIR